MTVVNAMKKMLLMLFLAPSLVFALGLSQRFLDYSGANEFTKDDWQLFYKTELETLNDTPNGKQHPWHNSATGHGGYFMPLATTKHEGATCRSLEVYNTVGHRSGKETFEYCKVNQVWRMANPWGNVVDTLTKRT